MAQLELPKLGVLCSPNACYFQLLLFGSTVWFVWLLRLMRLGDGNGGVWVGKWDGESLWEAAVAEMISKHR